MSWTKSQEEALQIRNKNLLLSAAAGSGKTAVLTERIIRLVKDPLHPVNINELLVLTFTKAAANEMKSRVAQSLTKELEQADRDNNTVLMHHLEKQISLMGSAQISTLDSFFQSILRQYFYLLDLDPKTQMLTDENEAYLLKDQVLSDVLETWYEKNDPHFLDTADLFASRYQDGALKQTILKIHQFACSMAFPEVWISHLPDSYQFAKDSSMDDFPWTKPILDELIATAEKAADLYRQAFSIMENNKLCEIVYSEQLSGEYSFFSAFAQVKTWKELYSLPSFQYATLKSAKAAQVKPFHITAKDFNNGLEAGAIKALRNEAKDTYTKQLVPFLSIKEDQWLSETASMYPIVKVLSDLALDFTKAYKEQKRKENLMDFNDLEHYVLDILLEKDNPHFTPEQAIEFPSAAALSIGQKYKEVMIDEYQDTNGVQELITALISKGNNRFMVGDIKQSIYRFRQADPTIFLSKYNSFSTEKEATNYRIDLNKNFRSDATILSSINFLFRQIMTEKNLELSYGDPESLYAGRHEEPRPDDYVGGSVSLEIIDTSDIQDAETDPTLKELENIQWEGRLIARRIHELIDNKKQVMNKDGTFRPITYSDIVILLRSVATKGPALLKVLEESHIPALSDREDDFVRNSEVEMLWALLKVLDNPLQDLAMTAILRSYFIGLDETDIARLALKKKEMGKSHLFSVLSDTEGLLSEEKQAQLSDFLLHFQSWRQASIQDGIAPLLRQILEDTDYLTYISGLPNGAFRKAHVLSFYELTKERDATSHNGLYPFLNYLTRLTQENQNFKSTTTTGTSSDAVRIMTIHRSKGLEFPVVFLADMGKRFNLQDTRAAAICHKNLGIGIQHYDKIHRLRWPSLYWYAVKAAAERESRAEEARLLYVAMTRARDKLYLTAVRKDIGKDITAYSTPLAGTGNQTVSPLPSHLISNGSSYLDWIFPAMLHHRSFQKAWDLVERIPVYQDDAPSDHSSFELTITKEKDLFTEDEQFLWNQEETISPEIAKEPVATTKESFLALLPQPVPDWMTRQLTWTYSHNGAVHTPAKLTATSAVKLREEAEYAASDEPPYPSVTLAEEANTEKTENEEENALPADYSEPPTFLQDDAPTYSGTTFGTLMHKAMEMIDFTTLEATETAIRARIQELSQKNVFTEEETITLLSHRKNRNPVKGILAFMESPLCQAMKEAMVIRKEMPFSILLPAHSFYPDCELEEKIFLQGVMDCMMENQEGILIIDYKTDRFMTEEELKNHYKVQLQVYGEAAEKLLGKPVLHLYLWSFTFGKMIEVPLASDW